MKILLLLLTWIITSTKRSVCSFLKYRSLLFPLSDDFYKISSSSSFLFLLISVNERACVHLFAINPHTSHCRGPAQLLLSAVLG